MHNIYIVHCVQVEAVVDRSLAASDQVQQEDSHICDSVQRGLASAGYGVGRWGDHEPGHAADCCSGALYCTVLYCTVLYCTVCCRYCTVLYCTVWCRYAPGVEMADHAFHQHLATQLRAELARETQ